MIEHIVAVDADSGIANETGIPWDLPGDIEHFRGHIVGKTLLMGRATYEHIMRARAKAGRVGAPGLYVYVATSASAEQLHPPLKSQWGETVPDLSLFMEQHEPHDLVVCGGADIYAATLPYADRLLITRLHESFGCTKFYPKELGGFALSEAKENLFGPEIPHTLEIWKRQPAETKEGSYAKHNLAA